MTRIRSVLNIGPKPYIQMSESEKKNGIRTTVTSAEHIGTTKHFIYECIFISVVKGDLHYFSSHEFVSFACLTVGRKPSLCSFKLLKT